MSWYFAPISDSTQLQDMFKLKPKLVEAAGYGEGKILKFQTFYLKIYPDRANGYYIVQGYQYYRQNPVIIDKVRISQMRKYAEQFTREDGLQGMIARHYNPLLDYGVFGVDNVGGGY